MDYRWYIPIEVCFLGRFNIEANCCKIMAKNTGIPYEALENSEKPHLIDNYKYYC